MKKALLLPVALGMTLSGCQFFNDLFSAPATTPASPSDASSKSKSGTSPSSPQAADAVSKQIEGIPVIWQNAVGAFHDIACLTHSRNDASLTYADTDAFDCSLYQNLKYRNRPGKAGSVAVALPQDVTIDSVFSDKSVSHLQLWFASVEKQGGHFYVCQEDHVLDLDTALALATAVAELSKYITGAILSSQSYAAVHGYNVSFTVPHSSADNKSITVRFMKTAPSQCTLIEPKSK